MTGPGDITARDIDLPSGVEILNPDAHIATLEKKTKLELYLTHRPRPRLPPGGGQQVPSRSASSRSTRSSPPCGGAAYNVEGARRPAHGLRQAHARRASRRRLDRSPGGAPRRGGDPDLLAVDLHRRGPHRGAARRPRRRRLRAPAGAAGAAGAGALAAAGGRPGGRPTGMTSSSRSSSSASARTTALKRAGIQTVGDLVSKSEGELAAIRTSARSRSTRSSRPSTSVAWASATTR